MSDKPDFEISSHIVMAHKATDLLTSDLLKSPTMTPKWGAIKAASMALKMVSDQLAMHADNAADAPKKRSDS